MTTTVDFSRCADPDCGHLLSAHTTHVACDIRGCTVRGCAVAECSCDSPLEHEPGPEACPCGATHPEPDPDLFRYLKGQL